MIVVEIVVVTLRVTTSIDSELFGTDIDLQELTS